MKVHCEAALSPKVEVKNLLTMRQGRHGSSGGTGKQRREGVMEGEKSYHSLVRKYLTVATLLQELLQILPKCNATS